MSIGKVSEFVVKTGVWSSYIERLEMYFAVNGVKNELKLPTLIAVMGDEAYELLVNLASPKKPSELSYGEAVALLRDHLQPSPSALAERFRFRQRRQASDENVASYVAELKKLTRFCKLGDNLNDNLRDQFVCGLRSDIIRQRLFAEDDTLTFTSAVKIASSLEAAERDAAAVDATGTAAGGEPEVAGVHSLARSQNNGRAGERPRRGAAGEGHGRRFSPANRMARAGSSRKMAQDTHTMPRSGCSGCGAINHSYEMCRFRSYVCSKCKRTGHLRRVCPGPDMGYQRGAAVHFGATGGEEGQDSNLEKFHHLCLNDYKSVSLPIQIETQIINMEVDTGAALSCINDVTFNKHFSYLKLEPTNVQLRFYDGTVIKPLGIIKPLVSYELRKKNLELFVIKGGTTSLLGRQWLAELQIKLPVFGTCHRMDNNMHNLDSELRQLFNRYKEVFNGGLGRYTGGKASLRVREGATPAFHRARPLPYALRERVDAALDDMLRDGVIEPVDCSDWASPLVPVTKADGSLRICADYKSTVNPALIVDRYPLPRIDDLIVRLSGKK